MTNVIEKIPATANDAVDGIAAAWLAHPGSPEELSQLLKEANASGDCIAARGGGTKLNWGNPPRALQTIVSTKKMNRIIEHADGDMTATAQAGCTVARLAAALAKKRQRLALDPLWPDRATVGGIIAASDSGSLRARYGTLRDHLIGITVVLSDGTIAKSGGKVVKNVAGYDLPKLFIGSFGTLGIVAEATFRLYPIAHQAATLRFTGEGTIDAAISAFRECAPVTSAVQFEIGNDHPLSVLVLVEGLPRAIDAKIKRVTQAAQDCRLDSVEVPPDAWLSRENLFRDSQACIAKFSALPTHLPGLLATCDGQWKIIAQAVGVGLISLKSSRLPQSIALFRKYLAESDGSLTILQFPPGEKANIDIWPDAGDALPLMRRIKQQFDPNNILSPGRFVGGI